MFILLILINPGKSLKSAKKANRSIKNKSNSLITASYRNFIFPQPF